MNILETSISFQKLKIINLGSSCIYPLNAENPDRRIFYYDGET